MATISGEEIKAALQRLGQLADERGDTIRLVLVGGAVMVLVYGARQSTRDVDAAILTPPEAHTVRELAHVVAEERNWPDDWLNDAAKGYLVGLSIGPTIITAPGIEVLAPSVAQLLAMKLSAWRDDIDIADARRLLQEFDQTLNRGAAWEAVRPFLVPGDELKAEYAFGDLWESLHG